jgi:Domain of unknown function (DUF4440)
MKLWSQAVVVAALVGFSFAGVHAESKDALVAAVKQRETLRQRAMVALDLEALDEIFAADATYIHSNGIAQSKSELIGMLKREEIRYVSFDVKNAVYRVYGQTVVGNGMQTITLTTSGRPFTSNSRYTVVYATIDGEPKVVAYQSTSLPDIVMQEMQKGE